MLNTLETEKVDFHNTPICKIFDPPYRAISIPNIHKFQKHHPGWFKNHYKFRDGGIHVGIEVEVENVLHVDQNIPVCFWSVHKDGSLRNNGFEFKTKPMPLRYTEAALTQLFDGLNHDIDFSKRTSIHVHVSVRKMSLSRIMGIVYAYAAVENLLFKYAGSERRNSIFCVPITETELLNNHFSDPIKNFYDKCHFLPKYSALNVKPITKLGTIEFRQLTGTTDIQKILVWMDMLASLRLFSYRNELDDIVKRIGMLNTSSDYRHFVESIFGPLIGFLDTSNIAEDMEKACYLVSNSSTTNQFHQRVLQCQEDTSSLFMKISEKDYNFPRQESKAIATIGRSLWPTNNLGVTWLKILFNWRDINKLSKFNEEIYVLGPLYHRTKLSGEDSFAE